MPAEEKRIHQLTSTATIASGSSFPLDKGGNAEALRITDADLATGLFDLKALTGNLVWVDLVNGSNATGQRGKSHRPFLTLTAAKTAAQSGDTIVVLPGAYSDQDLAKNGVTWLLLPGVTITGTTPVFTAGSGVTCSVRGWGEIQINTAASSTPAITTQHSTATLDVECKRVAHVGGTFGPAIDNTAGSLIVRHASIESSGSATIVFHAGGTTKLFRCEVRTVQGGSGHGILVSGAGLTVWDSVVFAGGSADSITAGAAQDVRIYGHCMANRAKHVNVTLLCGTLEVDTDVT